MLRVNQLTGFNRRRGGGTPFDITTGDPTSQVNQGSYTMVARNVSLPNGATVTHISVHTNTSQTVSVKICLQNSTTEFDFKVTEDFSHGGTGWEEFTLTTPYVVPETGTYRLACHGTSNMGVRTEDRSYKLANVGLGVNSGFSADTSNINCMKARGTQ